MASQLLSKSQDITHLLDVKQVKALA